MTAAAPSRDPAAPASSAPSTGTLTPPPLSNRPFSMLPRMKFIGGDPMKPATKRFAGLSYTSLGVPICCSAPSSRIATRCARVMASTWSWVT